MKKRYVKFLIASCATVQIFANPGILDQINSGEFIHKGGNFREGQSHVPHHGGVSSRQTLPVSSATLEEKNNIQGQGPVIDFGRLKEQQQNARVDVKKTDVTMNFNNEQSKDDFAKVNTSTMAADVSPTQKAKVEKIKKGLKDLQDDKVVGGVFKTLGMHSELDELLGNIRKNADEQQDDFSSDKAEKFLKKLFGKKDEISKLDEITRSNFLTKLQDVIKNNFADLSIEEMGQFLKTSFELTANATQTSTVKNTDKKDLADASVVDNKVVKSKEVENFNKPVKKRHGFGKGMMHHGSGAGEHAGLSSVIFGLAFATAIFVLVQELSNQEV